MQEVVQHINRLLTRHDYVVVPGFGGFVANYKAASIHPVSHRIHPPSKSLAFNRNLTQNDGLLVHDIARKSGTDISVAKGLVESFVQRAKATLDQKDVLVLPGIGKLFLDIEDTLQFVQSATANHLLDSYGLRELQAQPVLREKLVDTGAAIRTLEDEEPGPTHLRPIWWVAAALLVLILGAGTLYFTMPSVHERANGLFGIGNGFDSVEVTEQPAGVVKAEMKAAPKSHMTEYWPMEFEPIPEPVETEVEEPAPPKRTTLLEPYFVEANHDMPKGFFAIVGSFKQPGNADNYKAALDKDGYDAFLFPKTKNGFVRVGIYVSPNDQAKASDSIFSIRTDFQPDAWLIKNQ